MRPFRKSIIAAIVAPAILLAPSASAQTPSNPPTPADAGEKPAAPVTAVTAGWQEGFFLQSANGDFRLQIGLLVHGDGRFVPSDDEAQVIQDTFLIRRLRPSLRGRFSRRFEFYLNPDFAGNTLVVQDAYVDTVFAPAFRIRAGKGKVPFGFERLHSASNLLFFERALPTALAPNRDVGLQVLGDAAGGVVSYMAALTNGVTDGGSADIDTNDGKDVAARLVVRPFTRIAASPLRGLMIAAAGSHGRAAGALALAALRTQSAQQQYFSYSGAVGDGIRTRYSPQVAYYYKGFSSWFELVHVETPVRKNDVREVIGSQAWQIAGSYVLTREAASDAGPGVRPRNNFDFGNGHWGAFQIAARYHTLQIDSLAFTREFVTAGSSRKVEAWTGGLNWYLTQNFRYTFNVERGVFDDNGPGARRPEVSFSFRTQLNF